MKVGGCVREGRGPTATGTYGFEGILIHLVALEEVRRVDLEAVTSKGVGIKLTCD